MVELRRDRMPPRDPTLLRAPKQAASMPAPQTPRLSLAPQIRKRNPPLTEAFRVQVITTFYAPAVMGTSFAASLIPVAVTDETAVRTTEWRAAAQEAEECIRQGCAALRGMPSPGTQIPYTRAVNAAQKMERFLALWNQFLQDEDPKKLEAAGKTLKQAQDLLARAGQVFLAPRKRISSAKKKTPG
jgi:hypothetical protein